MFILLQPIVGVGLAPFATTVVHADENEEVEKPRPGINNADDTSNGTTQGSKFPSNGSGTGPIFGNPNSGSSGGGGSGGGGGVITDPTVDLDPTRPNRGDGDRGNGPLPENPNGIDGGNGAEGNNPNYGGGDPDVDGSNGSGGTGSDQDTSGGGSGGNGSETGGSGEPGEAGGENGTGDGNGSGDGSNPDGSDGSGDNDSSNGTGDGDTDSNGSDIGGPGGSDGTGSDGSSSRGSFEEADKIEIIEDSIKTSKDWITLTEIELKINNGEALGSSDVFFLLKFIQISDDEVYQGLYESLLSQAGQASSVISEIKDTTSIRYSGTKGELKFKDFLKPSTYRDALIDHMKDAKDPAYKTIFNEDKRQLVSSKDANKIKTTTVFNVLKDGFKKVTGAFDRGLSLIGKGLSGFSDFVSSVAGKGSDMITGFKNTVGNALNNAKTSFGKTFLNGVNGMIGAVDRGMTAVGGIADKFSKAGQWIANSSLGKTISNAATSVKNFGSNLLDSGKNLVDKFAKSKVGTFLSRVANSPLGKVGSVALSGLSIVTGGVDLFTEGPWHQKVSGGFSVVSGGLGIAAIVAAGTAAAPVLAAGALVAGVGALAFTYGPKLVNKWNESKFGSAVNKTVSNAAGHVADAARNAGKAVANTVSNIGESISSGFSSLFGR